MIETEQIVTINADIERVWNFARDIRGWASLMPGMQDCDVIDENSSRWTMKVGVGGLVRTVKVSVHVDQWAGPERVAFSYRLEGDPVQGGGSYRATAKAPGQTELALHVRVEGGGPMAPMWEAMGRPVLPQLAKSFAGQLRDRIEAAAGNAEPEAVSLTRPLSYFGAAMAWVRGCWNAVFGRTPASQSQETPTWQRPERTP